jgi:tetratricopeptide (TPR) repeat protein
MSESRRLAHHRGQFRSICREKWGNEFQTFFEKLMKMVDPDFTPIKTYGKEGDWKCDGVSLRAGIFYQVYAPGRDNLREAKKKAKRDLEGAVKKWGKKIKKWVFVYGSQSLPAPLADFVVDLGKVHAIDTHLWNEENIWERVKQLSHDERIELLEIAGELFEENSLKLDEILEILRNRSIDYEADPVAFSKGQEETARRYLNRYPDDQNRLEAKLSELNCNDILELVVIMFRVRDSRVPLVDQFYEELCEPDPGYTLYKAAYTYHTQGIEASRAVIKTWRDDAIQARLLNNLSVCILRDFSAGQARYKYAGSMLAEAETLAPENPSILRNLGISYMHLSEYQKAESTLKKALRINENWAPLRRSLGAVYALQLKNLRDRSSENARRFFQLGVEHASESIRMDSSDTGALLNLASLYTLVNRYQEAKETLEKARTMDPTRVETLSNLGYVLIKLKELQDAELALRTALKLKSNHTTALLNLGHIMIASSRFEEARNLYHTAISAEPRNGQFWYNIGVAEYHLSEWESAKRAYLKAIQMGKTRKQSWYFSSLWNLAVMEMDVHKDFAGAKDYLVDYLRNYPDRFEAWARISFCYTELDDYQSAERAYARAFDLKRDDADLWNNYGVFAKKMGNLEQARLAFNEAINIKRHPGYLYNLAGIYADDDVDYAIELCEKAIEIDPELTIAYKGIATLYVRKNDWTTALDHLLKAEELDPEDYRLANNKAIALAMTGDLGYAIDVLSAWVDAAPSDSLIRDNLATMRAIEGEAMPSYESSGLVLFNYMEKATITSRFQDGPDQSFLHMT